MAAFDNAAEPVRAWLYDAEDEDREVSLDTLAAVPADGNRLLWIDAGRVDPALAARLTQLAGIDARALARMLAPERPHYLDKYRDFFTLTLSLPPGTPGERRVAFAVGRTWLVSLHAGPVPDFIAAFRTQDKEETDIGRLTPDLLLAALLDWHLGAFFTRVSQIEARVDALDDTILAHGRTDGESRAVLGEIVAVRRTISILRRTLADQRQVFYGLSRSDVVVVLGEEARERFDRLVDRLERAIDEVERSRDVLIGSFDLFTSLASNQTNDLVKVLTFVTVVTGLCGVVAGLMGMNFTMPLFDTGTAGFLVVVGVLATASGAALWWARRRRWF